MIGAAPARCAGQALDHLALSELKHETISITQLIGERGRGKTQKTMDQVPLEQITPYAAEDADLALRLCQNMRPRLKTMGMQTLADHVEMPLIEVLAEMEYTGIRVDPNVLDEQKHTLSQRITALRDEIHGAAGCAFNIDSPKQLAEVLFTTLALPVQKRTKTGPSTDIEVLERLAEHEDLDDMQRRVPQLVVEYRQLTKLVGTYLEALKSAIEPGTGRIHATFHQTGTATGRLSSSNPNLQNIPIRTDIGRQIRKAFIADEGCLLVSADYSQIELRILAHLSGDKALIEAFQNDVDIHTAVAAEVFGTELDQVTPQQRSHAKVINFGIVYGVTPYGLARESRASTPTAPNNSLPIIENDSRGLTRFYRSASIMPKRTATWKRCSAGDGRFRKSMLGNPQARALGERLAINSVVQGSAADLIKQAMVNLHRRAQREHLSFRLLLQIHDELVIEAPEQDTEAASHVLRQEMENAMSLRVPLKAELGVGSNWFDAK